MKEQIKSMLQQKISPANGCLFPIIIVDDCDQSECDRALSVDESGDEFVVRWSAVGWTATKLQEYISAAFADDQRCVAEVAETQATIRMKSISKRKAKGKQNATSET